MASSLSRVSMVSSSSLKVFSSSRARRVRSFPSSGRQLLRTVREVAADGEMKARAEEMRRVIENQPGMDSIVEKIENIV